jgi:hypothetical protein
MPDLKLIETAKREVFEYALRHLDKTDDLEKFSLDETADPREFSLDNVYVTWFCKTLQNWKALVTTDLPDDTYYEVTYDGAMETIYIDVYKKVENVEINPVHDPFGFLEALRKQWAGELEETDPGAHLKATIMREQRKVT